MFELFKNAKVTKDIAAPVQGICISIEDVKDEVFSKKMIGDGFAIIAQGDVFCSPIDGKIILIPTTKHAFGVKRKDGLEILVHIGLDTVNLNGEGFTVLKPQGTKVKKGEPIIKIDYQMMKNKGIDITTMIIFTSGYDKEVSLHCKNKVVCAGDTVIEG